MNHDELIRITSDILSLYYIAKDEHKEVIYTDLKQLLDKHCETIKEEGAL